MKVPSYCLCKKFECLNKNNDKTICREDVNLCDKHYYDRKDIWSSFDLKLDSKSNLNYKLYYCKKCYDHFIH